MASIVLRTAGAAAGNAIMPGVGGAFFGLLGAAAGGFIDQQTGMGAHVTGPQLANLSVQDSRYGAGIPIVYGNARIAGNVIWSTDLIQTQHNDSVSGGKGGALGGSSVSATTYTYSVHCAVGVALGPIGGIATIWADSTIIYQDGAWSPGVVDGAVIYTGTTTQTPDAFMESMLGAGNVPAYRGLCFVVFENLQLSNFGNRLPNLTFEVAPAVTTSNPLFLGGVDVLINQSQPSAQSSGIRPITLSRSANEVSSVLVGGFTLSVTTGAFQVVEYDVTDTTPLELARVTSATFTANSPNDISWALAPDKRFVAIYVQNTFAPTHVFVLYDIEARQFGAISTPSVTVSFGTKQIAWLDAQHFVIDDTSGGARGVHVFARAGLNIIDRGFFGVWGAGSAISRLPIFYAQYTPFAGGLINYMTDISIGNYFSQIFARPLAWRNNTLVVGAAYTVASGLGIGLPSGPHANLIQTGSSEWTLCFGSVSDFHRISFEPGLTSATVTRPWQGFTPSGDPGSTQAPVLFGNRLVIVQRHISDTFYWLSEVLLDNGTFTLTIDGATAGTNVSNILGRSLYYCAIPLDGFRFLLAGVNGFTADLGQLFIIQRCAVGDGLDAIMSDILARAGYSGGDYDVSALAGISVNGYVLPDPMSARAAIEPLQVFAPFDLIESASLLRAVPRHANADNVIDASEWRACADKTEPPPPLEVTRAQELDLPVEVDVDFIDPSRDYEVNSQRARRVASRARNVQKINLPIVCSSNNAKQIAETRLYALWAERELVRLRISRRWLTLEPGDVIDLNNGSLLRVTNVNQAGGLMEVEGFYVNASIYASDAAADAGQTTTSTALTPIDSTLYLLDLPLLQNTDDEPGLYAAATGLAGWKGASLWRAADGINYSNIASLPQMASAGMAVTALGNGSGFYLDALNNVQVQLINGELSSCALLDLYNGANAALLGNEIIQFQTATLTAPGLYTLSNLLRGRRGTEAATTTHAIGEDFVTLVPGTVDFVPALSTDRGATYEFRALSNGQSLSDAQDDNFTYNLATIRPFAPANITGTHTSGTGSDLTLVWKRRARLNAEWVDFVDVPLDEPVELYDVDVMNGASMIRTFASLTSPTVTYTAAQQTADWGTVPASFTFNIYQISSRYGRGSAANAVI